MIAKHLSRDEKARLWKPNAMLSYVDHRLAVWARWQRRGNFYGLGYPACSIEYRLMHEGVLRTTARGQRAIEVNVPAEEMDALVMKLAKQQPLLAEVLRDYYFREGSLRVLAKAKGTSHTEMQRQVQQARYWIAGWLTAALEDRG
jgi:hypothetical protein